MPRLIRRKTYRPKKRNARKPYYRRKNYMKPMRSLNAMTDRAKVVEVEDFGTIQSGVGQNLQWQLSLNPRALAVARNYRFYRCTRVEFEFIPFANVFQPGTSFPELYYQADYTSSVSQAPPTAAQMRSRGVLPIKWTSIVKKYLSPAVLRFENMETAMTASLIDAQPVTSTPIKYKWYMTERTYNPSQNNTTQYVGPAYDPTNLRYHGAAFFVDSPIPAQAVGKLLIRTHWEFKQPLVVGLQDLSGNKI